MNDIERLTETTPPLVRLIAEGIASDLSTRDWTHFITAAVAGLREVQSIPLDLIEPALRAAKMKDGNKVAAVWDAIISTSLAPYPEPEGEPVVVDGPPEEGVVRGGEPDAAQSE